MITYVINSNGCHQVTMKIICSCNLSAFSSCRRHRGDQTRVGEVVLQHAGEQWLASCKTDTLKSSENSDCDQNKSSSSLNTEMDDDVSASDEDA